MSPEASAPVADGASRRLGVTYVLFAYVFWGIFPLYVRALARLRPLEILVHRMLWSAVFLLVVLAFTRRWRWLLDLRSPRVWLTCAASATALSCNWFGFLWAVDRGRVVDASLGYFINPFVSVLFGVVLLGERMRRGQIVALVPAACGVLWLTLKTGHVPWIGLGLAFSFGLYGLLRKTAPLGALEGLTLETLILCPVALALFTRWGLAGTSGFFAASAPFRVLVMAAGPVTAVPLLFFAAGARRIPLSVAGIIQYIGPSLQLCVGVFVFHEPFTQVRLVGFGLVWAALALYTAESLLYLRGVWSLERTERAKSAPLR